MRASTEQNILFNEFNKFSNEPTEIHVYIIFYLSHIHGVAKLAQVCDNE
jgi:hypothetical protein